MNFPQDPLRQKMLFKTEWKTRSVVGPDAVMLERNANAALQELISEGFNITQMMQFTVPGRMPISGSETQIPGLLIVGQRVTSAATDPTPQGVPVPGTNATQSIQIVYSFAEGGKVDHQELKTLKESVRAASNDLRDSSGAGKRQPISINVTSVTTYGPGDLHVLQEKT